MCELFYPEEVLKEAIKLIRMVVAASTTTMVTVRRVRRLALTRVRVAACAPTAAPTVLMTRVMVVMVMMFTCEAVRGVPVVTATVG